jgi:C4-dicarboxylate-specific signal transduction histidine kinase
VSQPDIANFPFWGQLLISAIVGIGALGTAMWGYFAKKAPEAPNTDRGMTALVAASVQDMGHMRHLADVCIQLMGAVNRNTDQLQENEYQARNANKLNEETCARLRESREETERLRAEIVLLRSEIVSLKRK